MSYFIQQSAFVLRIRYSRIFSATLRKLWYLFLGMKIGKNTRIPKIKVTWPHQVLIGEKCILEHQIFFKYDGIWKKEPSILIGDGVFIGAFSEFNISGKITIGKNAMIASGCKFIDHNHGMALNEPMNTQKQEIVPIEIGEEVWLGANVIVLKGVKIGKGAVIAAGSVVLKDIGDYEIYAGVPARFIKKRENNTKN